MKSFDEYLDAYSDAVMIRDVSALAALKEEVQGQHEDLGKALVLLISSVEQRVQDQLQSAYESVTQALDLANSHDGLYGLVLRQQAGVLFDLLDFPKALEIYNLMLDRALAGDDEVQKGASYNNVAMVYDGTGGTAKAVEYYERARQCFENEGHARFLGNVTYNLALSYNSLGDHDKVVKYASEARRIFESVNNQSGAITATAIMGSAFHNGGDPDRGLPLLKEAHARAKDLSLGSAELQSVILLVRSLIEVNQLDDAQALIDEYANAEERSTKITTQLRQYGAEILQKRGYSEEAKTVFTELLAVAKEQGRPVLEESMHTNLQQIAKDEGDFDAYVLHNTELQRINDEIRGADAVRQLAIHEKEREIDSERREREKERALLYGALPEQVATRMLRGETIEDQFTHAAVLFTDVVGFTRHTTSMRPSDTIKLLDDLYNQFDKICGEHGVTKVKTIGDSYLCFKGDGTAGENSSAMSAVAISMQRLETAWPDGESLSIRIGIHLGPVSAGVIGTQRLQYDVWGDTVNVASRMESTGEPEKIQVSEEFAQSLASALDDSVIPNNVKKRGTVEIKGKGTMTTYWLEGA